MKLWRGEGQENDTMKGKVATNAQQFITCQTKDIFYYEAERERDSVAR